MQDAEGHYRVIAGRKGVAVVSKRWFGWLMLFSAKCTLYHGRGLKRKSFFLCF